MDDQQIARYLATLAAERKAWAAVKDRLPGSSSYDPVTWGAWRQAVRDSDDARRALPSPLPLSCGRPPAPIPEAMRSPSFPFSAKG